MRDTFLTAKTITEFMDSKTAIEFMDSDDFLDVNLIKDGDFTVNFVGFPRIDEFADVHLVGRYKNYKLKIVDLSFDMLTSEAINIATQLIDELKISLSRDLSIDEYLSLLESGSETCGYLVTKGDYIFAVYIRDDYYEIQSYVTDGERIEGCKTTHTRGGNPNPAVLLKQMIQDVTEEVDEVCHICGREMDTAGMICSGICIFCYEDIVERAYAE